VDSIKDEMIDQGWTMERIWNGLISALQREKVAVEVEPEQVVDVQTGEIITQEEDLFGEREEAGAATAEAETKQPPAATAKPKRDPTSIKTINDLLKACNEDWKLQPKAVYEELNVKSASDIADVPAECYRKIQAVRN